MNRFRLQLFLQQLRILLQSGKSEAEALDLISRHTGDGRLRTVLRAAVDDLRSGRDLAAALFHQGHPFPPGMARCLRSVSTGDQDLPRTMESLEANYRIRVSAQQGATSPRQILFISVVFLVIAFFILLFFVPVYEGMYSEFGAALPILTQFVIQLSRLARSLWFLIPFVVIGVGYGIYVWWIKPASVWINMHQAFSLMAGRIRSGVEGERALAWAADSVEDAPIHKKLTTVLNRVKNGAAMSEAFRGGAGFPTIVADILALGEQTGDMRAAADEVAAYFAGRSQYEGVRFSLFIEMGFLLGLLIVLVLLVLSMYLPMFSMAAAVGG